MIIDEYSKPFFLYAKGWYEKTDMWSDLNKLYAVDHLIDPDVIEKDLIINKMTTCALECIMEKSRSRSIELIQGFLTRLDPDYWVYKMFGKIDYDYKTQVVMECMSIMRSHNIENLYPKEDCDFNILNESEAASGYR